MQVIICTAIASAQTNKVIYTCPMHPEVKTSKPGKCPKCGMTLVKKTIKGNTPKATPKKTMKAATGPSTRKESTNNKKPTTTSTQGSPGEEELRAMMKEMKGTMQEMRRAIMEMRGMIREMKGEPVESGDDTTDEHAGHDMNTDNTDSSRSAAKLQYTCPMHPEVQADKPGKCPK